jgi:hypothetical protein
MSANEALEHDWIVKYHNQIKDGDMVAKKVLGRLKRFTKPNLIQKAVLLYIVKMLDPI